MDPKRIAYIEEVCNQIKQVSATIGSTIKEIGYVGKYQALPPPRIIPSLPIQERLLDERGKLQPLYDTDLDVRMLVDQLSATQQKVDRLERDLLNAKLALADREADRSRRASPLSNPLSVAPKLTDQHQPDHTDALTAKLLHMQRELNSMIEATTGAIEAKNAVHAKVQ